jgi:hypothetical protein
MSIRLRRQRITGTIFDTKSQTPGPGAYTIQDEREIGKTRYGARHSIFTICEETPNFLADHS